MSTSAVMAAVECISLLDDEPVAKRQRGADASTSQPTLFVDLTDLTDSQDPSPPLLLHAEAPLSAAAAALAQPPRASDDDALMLLLSSPPAGSAAESGAARRRREKMASNVVDLSGFADEPLPTGDSQARAPAVLLCCFLFVGVVPGCVSVIVVLCSFACSYSSSVDALWRPCLRQAQAMIRKLQQELEAVK